MKVLHKFIIFLVLLFMISSFLVIPTYAQSSSPAIAITEWEMMWEKDPDSTVQDASSRQGEWIKINFGEKYPTLPKDIHAAWIRFNLPELVWSVPVLAVNKLYAQDMKIYMDEQIVYDSKRKYAYDKNQFLLPLNLSASNSTIYIKVNSFTGRLGLQEQLMVGEYQIVSKNYMIRDLVDVILGAALIFISITILVCMLFLNKTFMKGWSSLGTVILSVGLMILTYSPFVHINFSEYGRISYYMFDIASMLLMPSLFIFIEKVFGRGPYGLISSFRKIQVVITIISTVWLLISLKWESVYELYAYVSVFSFGLSIIVGNCLFIGSLIVFSRKGNRDAIIMTSGLILFAAIGASEVLWYFASGKLHLMFYWKFGILGFLISLIIILAKQISHNYEQVVKYSKQLEVFNNELQRSEKMEMISQLAASIAHEVRNPLQVTRGFLQLLGSKANNEKDKSYMIIAIDELDRASEIITDFLTFAKPQLEHTSILNIKEELQQIEGILVPLATMQGGIINVNTNTDLYVRGNSSKLKQALINIIKNSIESLTDNGVIDIQAYDYMEEVLIRIKDNGEGMNEADLMRLGEPYYSKKSKGTGLGLMVTFRIIEAMQGKIIFKSTKGVGTEVIIHLPAADQK
ncbi:sensor histidine kinase [Paenibacillus sp. PL91]|uniref:sensor histidine kinase n=1 Tax=Paenibacillus sp. PL91 TaxID=2729538 RepID=UPI00145CBE57|nr:HAMP domain-containing sensor histidine kinase [Paenibacillus sp. PL91]MBC9203564.1 HAMP domain-containing histidine kinase [Paenibacillus sp. PL91]